MVEVGLALVAVFLATLVLTAWMRYIALRRGYLDHPNARSSHSEPTPRGGGLAIAISASVAIAGFYYWHYVDAPLAAALIGGGLFIAAIGLRDDRHSLSTGIRLLAHLAAAAWAVYILGGVPSIRVGGLIVSLGIWGDMAGIIAIVWVLNLFNFMDGIDGIAASEAAFVTGIGGVLAIAFEQNYAVGFSAFAITAATLAFLWWNWSPAKIFMGDVGSGYLGYSIAVIGLAAGRASPIALLVWIILGGVFFTDATITLLLRFVRGERIYLAHRDHAYQHLAARWGSHCRVTLLVCAVNLLALFPVAWLACVHQELAATLAAVTLLFLSVIVLMLRKVRNS